jgi:hypothetical protein
MERCDVCGYEWDALADEELGPRLRAAVDGLITAIGRADADVRPAEATWSPIEYAAHVRDVLVNLRERFLLAAIEDEPVPPRIHPDERVKLGLYAVESPDLLATELRVGTEMVLRTLGVLSAAGKLDRPITHTYPQPVVRTLRWLASQMLHEAEHHLADVTPAGT